MKKFCAFALCLTLTPIAALAMPMSWQDSINFNDFKIGNGQSHSYTHNINDNGFDVVNDWVTRYGLTIGLRDDGDHNSEWVYVNQPGFIGDRVSFSASDITTGASFLGWASLNLTGLLSVTVESLRGDFILESSRLWASGFGKGNSASVPEPGSLALLGLGLVGLGLARRRLSHKH